MGGVAVRMKYLRERKSGLGLEAAEIKFLQKMGLLYSKSLCSERSQ